MSVSKQTFIYCDGGEPCPQYDEDQVPYTVDGATETAADQRATFPTNGWLYRGGKDYCPACVERLFKSSVSSTDARPK